MKCSEASCSCNGFDCGCGCGCCSYCGCGCVVVIVVFVVIVVIVVPSDAMLPRTAYIMTLNIYVAKKKTKHAYGFQRLTKPCAQRRKHT